MDFLLMLGCLLLVFYALVFLVGLAVWVLPYLLKYYHVTIPVILLSLLLPWYGCLYVIWVCFFICFYLSTRLPPTKDNNEQHLV